MILDYRDMCCRCRPQSFGNESRRVIGTFGAQTSQPTICLAGKWMNDEPNRDLIIGRKLLYQHSTPTCVSKKQETFKEDIIRASVPFCMKSMNNTYFSLFCFILSPIYLEKGFD